MLRFMKINEPKSVVRHYLKYLFNARDRNILVTTYHWPDIDGIASAYALADLLKTRGNNAKAMKWQEPQIEAKWAMDRVGITVPDIAYTGQDIVLVDVSDPEDLPPFLPLDKVKTVIDHRLYHDTKPFVNAEDVWIEPVGSACTLIGSVHMDLTFKPSIPAANMLYLGIMSNTIKCKSHNTTDKDREVIGWLSPFINIGPEVVDEMFHEKSKIKDIKQAILDDLSTKLNVVNNRSFTVAQLEIVDSLKFISENEEEILIALEEIRKERKADDILLVVVDVGTYCTHFIGVSENMKKLLEKKIPLVQNSFFWTVEDIFLRKEVIAMLLNATAPLAVIKNSIS